MYSSDEIRLLDIISIVQNDMQMINSKWMKNKKLCHQGNTTIADLKKDGVTYSLIKDYLRYLTVETLSLVNKYNQNNLEMRVKALNSVESKIDTYSKKIGTDANGVATRGKFPINKCLNDLFGARIFLKERISKDRINILLKENDFNLKCINADKQGYKANHIYFKLDNKTFQWELQVWHIDDSENNKKSHAKHKQEYTKWEEMIKEEL